MNWRSQVTSVLFALQAGLLIALPSGGPRAGERIAPVLVGEPVGGGLLPESSVPDPSEQQRRQIQESIDRNILLLEARGDLPPLDLTSPLLAWPLRPNNGLMDFGYHATSNFVDLDPRFPDQLLDYACGQRTYDRPSGYNHGGTDFIIWPFYWNKMDNGEVAIIAAAPGTIIFKQDGEYDRNCVSNNSPWNAVFVRHGDGSVAWYGHMKNGSVTPKEIGAAVAQGEYLGLVGSSGDSNVPHLHFEMHDSAGRVIDPHAGPCNPGSSWWAEQRPYFDSAINKLTSGFKAPVVLDTCPDPESPNIADDFVLPAKVYLTAYYRDQRSLAQDPSGAVARYSIYYPDGTLAARWTHSSPVDHYDYSYWYAVVHFPPDIEPGVYRWEAVYQGVSYNHRFTVSSPGSRDYAQCINGCDDAGQSCDSGCQDDCRAQFPADEAARDACVDACKDSCHIQKTACKDVCQTAK